ncbi:TPA: hypothetical protein KLD23_003169 [Legionella pneumophila]|nr:hypothetical protein [Legionella pneumophila]
MCRRFRYLGKTRYWTVSDNELVEAAGIEPATPDFDPDHDKQQKTIKNHKKSDS